MERPSFSSVTDQVAEALREDIRQGRWRDAIPGGVALARELGVNHKTVEAALKTPGEGVLAGATELRQGPEDHPAGNLIPQGIEDRDSPTRGKR